MRLVSVAPSIGLVLATSVFGGLGCGTARGARVDYSAEADPRKHDFVLGPADVLRVTVWHNPDLSADPIVRPDGRITLPLIGDVPVSGRTTNEVQALVTEKLKVFVKDEAALVTVAVTAVNSYRFTVMGNVEKAGTYSATHYVTFSEAMTLAGGPNRFATPEDTVIRRPDGANPPRLIPVDYPRVARGDAPQQDLVVVAGDIIYVP